MGSSGGSPPWEVGHRVQPLLRGHRGYGVVYDSFISLCQIRFLS